ncbi:hypothetical protein [Hymenobacter glaciei]|uniref:hypothetical protein n=1 Tax=Hymenobacter glaciei TaxID=877209 RepID=UPI0031EAFEFA
MFIGLLLVLVIALGTEVAALHHHQWPTPGQPVLPVVVRKSSVAPTPHKTVHTVRHRAG